MTMDPDVQLAANGDVEAFERIYRRHHSRVYTLCLRMVRNASQAEDLTQEVFIQLHRKLHTFRGDALLTTWLHRLTVNQVLMHFRKPIVKSEFTTDDEATLVPVASGTERPDRMAVIDRIALMEAIGQLAPGYRLVLLLHDVEGYEHDEIAKMLGCAVGTSKSQLHKARMKVRQLLANRQSAAVKPLKTRPRLNSHLKFQVGLCTKTGIMGWPRRATPTKRDGHSSNPGVFVGVALRGHPRLCDFVCKASRSGIKHNWE